jgi:2'-5' RNA ligase
LKLCYDEHMELTSTSRDYLNQSANGYMINTLLSESAQNQVKTLQDIFVSEFRDAIWMTPADALHITLLDWLAPLVDYSEDKDSIFERLYPQYDDVLTSILADVEPIDAIFNRMVVSSSAIAIVADEKSTAIFNDIRQKFLEKISLLPNTKQPPNIVHCTIVRFVGEIALDSVKKIAITQDFSFIEQINGFQLVRETVLPMLDYSVVKKYPLM